MIKLTAALFILLLTLRICAQNSQAYITSNDSLVSFPKDANEIDGKIYFYGEISNEDGNNYRPLVLCHDKDTFIDLSHYFPQKLGSIIAIFRHSDHVYSLSANQSENKVYLSRLTYDNGLYKYSFSSDSFSIRNIYNTSIGRWHIFDEQLYFLGLGYMDSIINPQTDINIFLCRYTFTSRRFQQKVFEINGRQFPSDFVQGTKKKIFLVADNLMYNQKLTADIAILDSSMNVEEVRALPGSLLSKSKILSIDNDTITLFSRYFGNDSSTSSSVGLRLSTIDLNSMNELKFKTWSGKNNSLISYYNTSGLYNQTIWISTTVQPRYSNPFKGNKEDSIHYFCLGNQFNKGQTNIFSIPGYYLSGMGLFINTENELFLYGTAYDISSASNDIQAFVSKVNAECNLITGMSEQFFTEDFLLFPNPGTDYLDISLPNAARGRFSLFDIQGRLIIRQRFEQRLRIPTAKLPAGIYIYRIRDDKNRMQHGKWVKQ